MRKKYEKTLGPKNAGLISHLLEQGKEIFYLQDANEIFNKGKKETTKLLYELNELLFH